jgi:carbohydrate-binding DOMON domain-containing protein
MNKNYIIATIVLVVAAYFGGRLTGPERVKIEKQIVTVEVEKTKVDQVKDQDKVTTITKNKDGTTTTVTETKTHTDTKKSSETDTTQTEHDTKDIVNRSSLTTISLLGGINATRPQDGFVYGLQVTKPILGPIVIGVWGLTDKTIGANVGLQF